MVKKRIPKKIKKKISNYIDILKKDKLPVSKIILFGSYAKGTQHKWSDIDLCVVSPKFHDFVDDMQYLFLKRIDNTIPHIEPIGINPKDFRQPSSLTEEIRKHGVEIRV
ncbi:MAG: nucleotidyltransferase domain-containing protein [Candidatus Kuenenbacteria bacterium]